MQLNTILVIEDDKAMRTFLREVLQGTGFVVLEASNGARALDIIDKHNVDAIILDLNLPDQCGILLAAKIREKTARPLLVVSGEPDKTNHIKVFENGADDFISKPVDPMVFPARIKAHLRRYVRDIEGRNNYHTFKKLTFLNWILDQNRMQLRTVQGEEIALTPREYEILDFLLDHIGVVLKREDMCDALKCYEDQEPVSPRTLDVHIARLRKKMNEGFDDDVPIKTVRGYGYLMDCVIEEE